MGTPEWTAREAIEAASKYGYTGIDLRISNFKGELNLSSSEREILEIKDILTSENVQLAGLLCYNEVGGATEKSWQKMKDSILKHLEIGLKLNSPSIRIFGGNPHKELPFEDYTKRLAETIATVLEITGNGIYILIQNHGGSYTAQEAISLIKMVDNKRFRLVFSPDHSVMMKENLKEVYTIAKPLTYQIYVSDVIPARDEKNKRDYTAVLPGRGIVPIKEAYKAMGGKEFKGFISFKWEKIWQENLEEPEVALPYFIEYWEKITS